MPKQHANTTTIPVEYKLRAFDFECFHINFSKDTNV